MSVEIREVWNDNLEDEFAQIRGIVEDYPYIAMATEVHGDVLRPLAQFNNILDYNYHTMKVNVDMLKLTKLGLTFSDKNGNIPTCGNANNCIWQFNFREFNTEQGIDVYRFGELLMSSSIVLNDENIWVTFYGGYGLGYLIRLLTQQNLPESRVGFFNLINFYFPMVYDIKHVAKFCNGLHGDLNELADILDVRRIGVGNQAGSDSLLTSQVFKMLKDCYFNGSVERYAGVLFGFGVVTEV